MKYYFLSTVKKGVIKTGVVKSGKIPRSVKFGAFKKIHFLIDYEYQTQFYFGLYEKEIYNFLKKLSKDIVTALDVGAGEGIYSLYFIKKTSAKIIFICEPRKHCREIIANNIRLNYPIGDCKLEFIADPIGVVSKNQYPLDSLIHSIETPCLIKVDIDGGEVDLLRGATAFLKLPQLRWIIETHSKRLEEQCIQILEREGYATQIVQNAWWRLLIPDKGRIPFNRWLLAIPRAT